MIYNPVELVRIVAVLEAAATALEVDLVAALALRPVAAAVALAKVGHTVLRIRKLQAAVVAAGLHYNALENNLPNRMQALLGGTLHLAGGLLAGALAPLPLIGETRVTAKAVSGWFSARQPRTLTDLIAGLVATEKQNRPVVRIEQVFGAATRQFVVYVPGTQQWSPLNNKNPLDLGSDLQAYAGAGRSGSERAVAQAMRAAGIGKQPTDRVLFVGFSQGALVSANLAATAKDYKVSGLVSLGGPISQVHLPAKLPVLAIEHQSDVVPLLDGGTAQNTGNRVTLAPPALPGAPAHNLLSYSHTAQGLNSQLPQGAAQVIDELMPAGSYTMGRWFELSRESGTL